MQIDYIPIDRLSVSKANMRQGKKPPDVSDILPSVIKRGVIIPVIVRPNCQDGHFEICAGKRRYFASLAAQAAGKEDVQLPCITIAANDDADALEISMIENMLRQSPDPVTQWESYTRLVKEGRTVDDIAATFALTELQVKRILALGNLLPRIRDAYRAEEIDAATVRHLTLASKAQQKAWLALFDDEDAYTPRGHQLKEWLFGGGAISTSVALFDLADYQGQIVTDLFEEQGYFADADAFWAAQSAEIEKRKAAYLDDGWSAVEIVPPQARFNSWEYEKAPKRKGGRVYIAVNNRGEVTFHEGYVTAKEGQRLRKAEAEGKDGAALPKVVRPELTSTLTAYVDLHRHAAVRTELAAHPSVALRVMVAHAIAGSPLWKVEVQSQRSRNESVTESVEACAAETAFDERRRAVIACLGFDAERATVTSDRYSGDYLGPLVERLLDLPDAVVMEVLAVVMAETLASGSELIETLGVHLAVDMAKYWTADAAFYEALRDREVATAILAEVGGEAVASANAKEKGKTIKGVIADCLTGENGRTKREAWVPRWMAFSPSAYTERGGVATVKAAERARWIAEQERPDEPDPDAPVSAAALATETEGADTATVEAVEEERLAA
jgi:ParB family transcriptional regulator, chromosome partitioning protein